jgi:elongation factor P hydroxylase
MYVFMNGCLVLISFYSLAGGYRLFLKRFGVAYCGNGKSQTKYQ